MGPKLALSGFKVVYERSSSGALRPAESIHHQLARRDNCSLRLTEALRVRKLRRNGSSALLSHVAAVGGDSVGAATTAVFVALTSRSKLPLMLFSPRCKRRIIIA